MYIGNVGRSNIEVCVVSYLYNTNTCNSRRFIVLKYYQ
jgi:hypothetical protein